MRPLSASTPTKHSNNILFVSKNIYVACIFKRHIETSCVRQCVWFGVVSGSLHLLLFLQSCKNNAIHIPYKCELLYSNVSFDKISDTERVATNWDICAKPDGKSRDYSTRAYFFFLFFFPVAEKVREI